MIYDCHLHTEFSGDSEASVCSQIERAISLGMKEMTITDHHDYDTDFCGIDFRLDLPAYLDALEDLRERYRSQIRINLGVELGLQNHLEGYLNDFCRQWSPRLDFIIGSSHYLRQMDPYNRDYWETLGEKGGLEEFFRISLERVQRFCHLFDSFGHLDYAVRYAPHTTQFYSYSELSSLIDPLLRCLIESGTALECNTAGYRYGLSQPNPSPEILRRYRELGGELITIGSDSHKPDNLGQDFSLCRELLLELGFRYYAVYHAHKPEMIPL